ncbi:MAG: cobalamin-binding protein [Firmicutes bacterium]|nr:cobalamin-binding protein [Bacillota bacterium]
MKKSLLFLVLLLFIGLFLIGGCDGTEQVLESDQSGEEEIAAETSGEIIVTDQMGREVVFSGIPDKIISLSPSNTEVVFALGLADRLVGVTEYCNYPAEAQEKEIVGGFSTPNLERIVELEPGLVIASTIHVEEVPRMEELGISVLVVESANLIELYSSISLVAEVTGVTANGEALIASMQERIQAVEAIVSQVPEEERVKVYYEVYSDPLMSAGRNAFINEIISLAGGVNIFGDIDESYPQISAEVVAERQPDIILYPDYHGTADFVIEAMTTRPGWENMPAVLNNQVYGISDDSFARPGPRVVEAIEEAARIFYPHLF